MNKKKLSLVLFLSLFLVSNFAFTQEKKKVTDVEELSLEELLNQEVTVASKKAQKIEEAPAIISVITKKEITERGYLNLYDVLTSLPGINSIETYWGFNQLFFRGIYSPLYNDKSLVLINGHPFWDSINGSYYIEAFPIEAVKKIEVIRGPGSTLYGTNAFAGVINIVTEEADIVSGNSSWYLAIENEESMEGGYASGYTNNKLKIFYAIGVKKGTGYSYNIPADELGNKNIEANFINNYGTLYTNINYGGLTIDLFGFTQDKSKIDAIPAVWGTLEQTHNNWNGFFVGAKYKKEISSKLNIILRTSYNKFLRGFFSRLSGGHSKFESSGIRYDGELNLNYMPNEDIFLVSGIQYEFIKGNYYNIHNMDTGDIILYGIGDKEVSDSNISGYLQGDFSFGKIGFVGGVRVVNNKDYGNFINPRAGIVFKASKKVFLKALYGNAFRAPNLFEKYANFSTTKGNTDLDPEKISTMDLGVDILTRNVNIRLNYYYANAKDLIGRSLDPELNITKYFNLGESTYTGAEFEIRGKLVEKTTFFLNGSYIKGEDTEGNDIPYIPDYLSNGGITYNGRKILASFYYNYISPTTNPTLNGDVDIDSTFILNTKLGFKISEKLTFSLIIHNIFDKDVWAPEFIRKKIGMLQNGPGRLIYFELRKIF